MRSFTIAGQTITDDSDAFVIAEIGCNHGGSVQHCQALFRAAADAGADAVKLQKRDMASWPVWCGMTEAEYHAPYHSEHAFGASYAEHRAALEFGAEQYRYLKGYAESLGLVFIATAFDVPSVAVLADVGVSAIKVASASITNLALLRAIRRAGIPVLLSTGGGSMEDVRNAGEELTGTADRAYLQCTAIYPAAPADLNLNVIATYREAFPDTVIGLSDHQDGIDLGPAAYVLGARIFEKHFTLDHNAKGSDNRFSLEPPGMAAFVRSLKRTREALGSGEKRLLEGERASLIKMGRRDLMVPA